MNCQTCGILYQDDTPHPPAACAAYAGAELKKAKQALDGALDKISVMAKEREKLFTPRELNMAIDSVSRNYGRQRELGIGIKELEELRLFHLKLVKWKRKA